MLVWSSLHDQLLKDINIVLVFNDKDFAFKTCSSYFGSNFDSELSFKLGLKFLVQNLLQFRLVHFDE